MNKLSGISRLEEAFQRNHERMGHRLWGGTEFSDNCEHKNCKSFREALRGLEAELTIPS